MKLIHDCIREVLLYIEDNQKYDDILNMSNMTSKYSHEDICYTCEKLAEANFLKINKDLLGNVLILNMTYNGHQFLDNIRDSKVWSNTKSVLSKFESVSIEIISKVASNVILSMIQPTSVS